MLTDVVEASVVAHCSGVFLQMWKEEMGENNARVKNGRYLSAFVSPAYSIQHSTKHGALPVVTPVL